MEETQGQNVLTAVRQLILQENVDRTGLIHGMFTNVLMGIDTTYLIK